MSDWLERWIRPLIFVSALIAIALSLIGCASPTRVVCDEPLQLPQEMTREQTPDASAFSERVSIFFRKLEAHWNGTPQVTTPSLKQ